MRIYCLQQRGLSLCGFSVFTLISPRSEEEARDEVRTRFFKDASNEHWNWILIGLEAHPGVFWPEYLTGFRMPPDELEMHWQSKL
jgi:hypothetical protein